MKSCVKHIIMLIFTILACLYVKANDGAKNGQVNFCLPANSCVTDQPDTLELSAGQQEILESLKSKQVKEICGVKFGERIETAVQILKRKFGEPRFVTHDCIWYKNLTYGGVSFENVLFNFQSDGKRTYMNSCDFFGMRNALEYVKVDFEILLKKIKKYDIDDKTAVKNNSWAGGISPLWDGNLKTITKSNYFDAVYLDIKEDDKDKGQYFIRLMYGHPQICPFIYIDEEF